MQSTISSWISPEAIATKLGSFWKTWNAIWNGYYKLLIQGWTLRPMCSASLLAYSLFSDRRNPSRHCAFMMMHDEPFAVELTKHIGYAHPPFCWVGWFVLSVGMFTGLAPVQRPHLFVSPNLGADGSRGFCFRDSLSKG